NTHLRRGVLQVSEVSGIARYAGDLRINLVERPLFARTGIRREAARSQADYGDPSAVPGWKSSENVTDRPGSVIVGNRLSALGGICALGTVICGSVHEP